MTTRLLTAFAEAQQAFQADGDDAKKAKVAKDTMDSLSLFKNDLAAYVRVYGFLSQIFDYGNTDIEKRSIFFRLLHPLLTYGREREGVDLSALKLTAYTIKSLGDPTLSLGVGRAARFGSHQPYRLLLAVTAHLRGLLSGAAARFGTSESDCGAALSDAPFPIEPLHAHRPRPRGRAGLAGHPGAARHGRETRCSTPADRSSLRPRSRQRTGCSGRP